MSENKRTMGCWSNSVTTLDSLKWSANAPQSVSPRSFFHNSLALGSNQEKRPDLRRPILLSLHPRPKPHTDRNFTRCVRGAFATITRQAQVHGHEPINVNVGWNASKNLIGWREVCGKGGVDRVMSCFLGKPGARRLPAARISEARDKAIRPVAQAPSPASSNGAPPRKERC